MRPFFRRLVLICALAPCGAAAQPGGPQEALRALGTAELARRLLPNEIAGRVVDHRVIESGFPGGAAVEFYGPPSPHPDGTCRRERHFVPVSAARKPSAPASAVQVALAPRCRLPAGALFANIQPHQEVEGALAALLRLKDAQALAASERPLPFDLNCSSAQAPGRCASGAGAVLAALPLDRVHIAQPHPDAGWDISVMPSGPGQPYWRVRMFDAAASAPARIALSWELPGPF